VLGFIASEYLFKTFFFWLIQLLGHPFHAPDIHGLLFVANGSDFVALCFAFLNYRLEPNASFSVAITAA